ncbi:unnamed protein product, partial [marine sediment metagenome]
RDTFFVIAISAAVIPIAYGTGYFFSIAAKPVFSLIYFSGAPISGT